MPEFTKRVKSREGVRAISFLSDLFHGNVGNLGHDLNPGNILSDAGSDFKKQPSWLKDLEIAAPLAIGTILTAGADLPALAGGAGLFGADAAAGGAALGADAVTGADIFGTAAIDPITGLALDAGTAGATAGADAGATALGFAGDVGAGTGATAGGGALDAVNALAAGGTGATSGAGAGGLGVAGIAGQTVGTDLGVTAAPTSIFDTLGDTASTIGGGIKAAAPYVGAAGLAGSLYQGYQTNMANKNLAKTEAANATNAGNIAAQAQSIAAPLINQGQTLTSYLSSGTLPPQFQSQVDQAIASQRAGIIQGYASRGMSTDPTKNSALQQDLAAVDNSKATLMTQLESQLSTAGQNMINTANQLLATGLSATNLESQIPIEMSKLNMDLNKAMMQSISNFAAAMNGGRGISSQTQAAA